MVVLGYLGVYSHVFLDYLNNYGVRLLAPFDWRWFYGDALFIVDPWIWLVLAVGFAVTRYRSRRPGADPRMSRLPARLALGVVAGYVLLMGAIGFAARQSVEATLTAGDGRRAVRVMAAPEPVHPLRRRIVAEVDDE